ncbi:uncharacterized protein LOC141629756 [Silene latifolia]|uniref:uncharacterized protein LOC141629756 n=1 Tax=Silene latifolia TaxID=37657 RepID=UPI003D789F6F
MAVLEGYLRRIWHKHTINKISFMPNGIFIVRFHTKDMQDQVLNTGHYLFDSKPVIIKPWQENVALDKEHVKNVPTWLRLHHLPLKFWGQSLPKIAGLVGKYIQKDNATEMKTRLAYARVLVEVQIDQKFPEAVKFHDEKKQLVEVKLEYEWKPVLCTHCKTLGHAHSTCRRGKSQTTHKVQPIKPVKQVWRKVEKPKSSDQGNADNLVTPRVPAPRVEEEPVLVQIKEFLPLPMRTPVKE